MNKFYYQKNKKLILKNLLMKHHIIKIQLQILINLNPVLFQKKINIIQTQKIEILQNNDTRCFVLKDKYDEIPIKNICRIFIDGSINLGGTGVFIDKNKILTAAHCLFNRKEKKWVDSVTVIPQYNGSLDNQIHGKLIYVESNYFDNNVNNLDIGVIILENNYNNFDNLYINIDYNKILLNNEILIYCFGYPCDKGDSNSLVMDKGKLKHIDNNILKYKLNTEHGNSGCPIYDEYGNIIAIHSGCFSDDLTKKINNGTRINNVLWQKILELKQD